MVGKEVVCDDVREGSRSQMKQGMQATVTSSDFIVNAWEAIRGL